MDHTSKREMRRFSKLYLDPNDSLRVLDIGSLDVNGSHRRYFLNPKWEYVGLDIKAGRNVDVVAEDPYCYPLPSGSFDAVISGQTIEHVEDVHRFVLEARRLLKKDGVLCIIAPWTWREHRFPLDCWRILPDGMRFLLGSIAELPVLEVRKVGDLCVGIAGTLRCRT